MQTPYFLRLQRDRRVSPAKANLRVMTFSFGQFRNTLHESEGLRKISELERPLDAPILIMDRPLG